MAAQQGSDPEPNTLAWYAQRARDDGKDQVAIPAPIASQISVPSLDAALERFSVLVGTFAKREAVSDGPYSIVTLYRFQVIDNLSLHPYPVSRSSTKSFFPSSGDYIEVKVPGGSIELDGIKLSRGNELSSTRTK
jgi:hypothetical protein